MINEVPTVLLIGHRYPGDREAFLTRISCEAAAFRSAVAVCYTNIEFRIDSGPSQAYGLVAEPTLKGQGDRAVASGHDCDFSHLPPPRPGTHFLPPHQPRPFGAYA